MLTRYTQTMKRYTQTIMRYTQTIMRYTQTIMRYTQRRCVTLNFLIFPAVRSTALFVLFLAERLKRIIRLF